MYFVKNIYIPCTSNKYAKMYVIWCSLNCYQLTCSRTFPCHIPKAVGGTNAGADVAVISSSGSSYICPEQHTHEYIFVRIVSTWYV